MKSIQELTKQYEASLTRYAVIKRTVPIFRAELENWKDKTFNIRAVNAIVEAIKTACPDLEIYGSKQSGWNDETFYYVSIGYMAGDQREREKFDTQFSHEDTQYLRFSNILDRFNDIDVWITEVEKKATVLAKRHAEATKRLEALKDYEDLID